MSRNLEERSVTRETSDDPSSQGQSPTFKFVECLINLPSKFTASLLSASSGSPERQAARHTSSSCRPLLCSYPHEFQDRDRLCNSNGEARPTNGGRLVQASDSRVFFSKSSISTNQALHWHNIRARQLSCRMHAHTRATAHR